MEQVDDIYKEHIIEIAKSSKYFVNDQDDIKDYKMCVYKNTSCGDSVILYVKTIPSLALPEGKGMATKGFSPSPTGRGQGGGDGVLGGETIIIQDIKIKIDGCIISRASTNIYLDNIINKSIEEVNKLMPYDMHNMLGVKVSEMRAPCVLTPYNAIRQYLAEYDNVKNI